MHPWPLELNEPEAPCGHYLCICHGHLTVSIPTVLKFLAYSRHWIHASRIKLSMTAWINRCVESCLGQVSQGPLIPSQTSVWSIHLHETGRVHGLHLLTPSNCIPPVPFSSICPFSLSYLCQRRGICQKTHRTKISQKGWRKEQLY